MENEIKMGRPTIGITKKVSITLPNEYWDKLEKFQEVTGAVSRSELLRCILVSVLMKEIPDGVQSKKGNLNVKLINDFAEFDDYPEEFWD